MVRFHLPWHWGNSMAHTWERGNLQGASMGQKGVTLNPRENPPEHSLIRLREKPVSDLSLCRTCETGLIRMNQKVWDAWRIGAERVRFICLQSPAESRNLRQAQNGITERSNDPGCSRETEQVASRRPQGCGVTSEAKAQGNAWDTLTEVR